MISAMISSGNEASARGRMAIEGCERDERGPCSCIFSERTMVRAFRIASSPSSLLRAPITRLLSS